MPNRELIDVGAGHRVATRTYGTGPLTLVCTPGGPGGSGTLLEETLAPLRDRIRQVFWDCRGCGESPATRDCSMAGDQADFARVIEVLGKERPVLLGHSYGGMLTQRHALAHGPAIRGVVLVNTVPNYGALVAGAGRRREHLSEVERADLGSKLGRCMRGEATSDEVLAYRSQAASPRLQGTNLLERMLQLQQVTYPVRLAVQRDIYLFDVQAELAGLTVPALVTGSPHDTICGDRPRWMAEQIPEAEYVDFPGSGHTPQLEEPEKFVTMLEEWLARKFGA